MLIKYLNSHKNLARIIIFYTCLILPITFGCSNKRRLQNEENPFYKRGMQLQQDGNYEDAAAAFSQCLQYSPTSYKAYLQLALIYEDYKQDYPQAIINYKKYLEISTEIENLEIAEQWLRRVEKKYFEALRLVYGDPVIKSDTHSLGDHEGKKQGITSNDFHKEDHLKNANEGYEAGTDTLKEDHDISNPTSATFANSPNDGDMSSYYIVQEGDTLVEISKKLFGSQKYWQELYEYNQDILQSPEVLQIGQRLRIPSIASE